MNGHIFDDLPLLLTGDADRATVVEVAQHLRECDDCRDELISAVVAHAALASAAKYAPEVGAGVPRLAPRLAASDAANDYAANDPDHASSSGPLPDLSAVFAQVRSEANGAEIAVHRRRPPRILLVAASIVAALAIGGGVYLGQNSSSGPSARNVSLQAFDQGTSSAKARLVGDNQMKLDASSLPALGAGRYYEVWLTNGARTSMAPIGVLGSDGTAEFRVPATEMATYAAIEVSVQDTNGVGTYSGHSVLRGNYA